MALASTFKPGEEVQHKSGGSMMIVTAVEGTKILCEWVEGGQKRQEQFEAVALEHYRKEFEDWQSLDHDADFMTA